MSDLDHVSTSRTESTYIRRQKTGRHYLTVRDVEVFVELCRQNDIPWDTEIHIDRSGGEVPGDSSIWCRSSAPIKDGAA